MQSLVNQLCSEDRKYVNYEQLMKRLENHQFNNLSADAFINKAVLFRGVQQGEELADFMQKFGSINLDVVSLAEAREAVQNAAAESEDKVSTVAKINAVLDYADK